MTQPKFPAARRWPKQLAPHVHDHIEHIDDAIAAEHWRGRFRCVDCGDCTKCGDQYYMVGNKLWKAAGMEPNGGMLCLACLEHRIGRPLVYADFTAKLPGLKGWQRYEAARRN